MTDGGWRTADGDGGRLMAMAMAMADGAQPAEMVGG
jgi:hypothetical protein